MVHPSAVNGMAPAWLSGDAPSGDVVLSSRCRILRNLVGYRFPHIAERSELEAIFRSILPIAKAQELQLNSKVSPVERERLIAWRFASHHFRINDPGRALFLDERRALSLMVNEEDHLRLQALTAGWSIKHATKSCETTLRKFGNDLDFAWSERFGFLAASPYNAGEGRRLSAMFHLIGLAHSRRLGPVLKAISARGMTARGLFGESSRAVGAFVQVSTIRGQLPEFIGACEYLIEEERRTRSEIGERALLERTKVALDFAKSSPAISLADTLRVLAWARWAASQDAPSVPLTFRDVDALLATLELRTHGHEGKAAQRRATFLRTALGQT